MDLEAEFAAFADEAAEWAAVCWQVSAIWAQDWDSAEDGAWDVPRSASAP